LRIYRIKRKIIILVVEKSLKFANTSEELGQVIIRWDPKNPPKPGQTVTVGAKPDAVHLFDAVSGKRLN